MVETLIPFLWPGNWLLQLRAGYRFHQVEPLHAIDKLALRPLLLIHGERNQIITPHDTALLYYAADEPEAMWMVPHADHCEAYFENRKEYITRMVTLFKKYLICSGEMQQQFDTSAHSRDGKKVSSLPPDQEQASHSHR